jgi:hypothetical protein
MSFSELYSMSYHGLNLESPDSTEVNYTAKSDGNIELMIETEFN